MTATGNFEIEWIDSGREPQCAPNPDFPNGMDVDASMDQERTCTTALPYPAKRCGQFIVHCKICDLRVVVTTAGRPDDPKSLKLPCLLANVRAV